MARPQILRRFIFFCCFLAATVAPRAQIIFVVDDSDNLYRLTLSACEVDFVVRINRESWDISFDPQGNLYGVSANGNLFSIDTLTGLTNVIHDFNGQSFNSLTISADGTIYTTGDRGILWKYDRTTGTAMQLGAIGYDATGDLTFYQGDLYVAAEGDRIVKIDLTNPSNSIVSIDENIPGNVLGIVSDVISCQEINVYAITGGFSDIYQVDFENNNLILTCRMNINIGGGASTSEFLGSNPLVIDTAVVDHADCFNENGAVMIEVSGGNGLLTYELLGGNMQTANQFTNLSAGEYGFAVMDAYGCRDTVYTVIDSLPRPRIDTIIMTPITCNVENGALQIVTSGGTEPYHFVLNESVSQTFPYFDSLFSGTYDIFVEDANGCYVMNQAVVDSLAANQILTTSVQHTSCGEANGQIEILTTLSVPSSFSLNALPPQTSPLFSGLSAGIYTVMLSDMNGCRDTIAIQIDTSEVPVIIIADSMQTTCGRANGSISLEGQAGIAPYQFSKDGLSFQMENFFPGLAGGVHTFYILDQQGCTNKMSFTLASSSGPVILSTQTEPTPCGEDNGSVFANVAGGSLPYQYWLESYPEQTTPDFYSIAANDYLFQVTDANGCSTETIVVVDRTGCPVFIPNVFSPNGDGINDVFQLYTVDAEDVQINRFFIFDRWGNNVYEKYDFNIHDTGVWWDGMYKRFTMNPGVFAYYVEVEFSNGDIEVYKGDVTLLR